MAYPAAVKNAFTGELTGIREKGLFKEERAIHSPQSAHISVEFPRGAELREAINLCANNYLGLSSHPDVVAAAHKALDERGYGMSSVRFICGTQDVHRKLEDALTTFLGTEDTILFASCLDANAGVFEAILTPEDVMISDRLVHASIVDGIRLCKAMHDTSKHCDMAHLEQKLQEHQDKRVRVIITDGVFSMDGDLAPLDEICRLAEQYNALVFLDDSHASGFIGKTGRGVHEHFGVMGKIDILTTTLGKGLGGATGGCVSGRKEIVELCRQRARPYLFSNAVPPPIASARRRHTVSPSPVPPNRRVVDASACTNGPKISHCLSGAMPIPVSATVNRNATSPEVASCTLTSTTTSPGTRSDANSSISDSHHSPYRSSAWRRPNARVAFSAALSK
jgi:glycine C-acetyltransferase